MTDLVNVAIEIAFVGSFYKKPELYVEYGRSIKSDYDLADEATRFFYQSFEVMFTTYSQDINQQKLAAFMAGSPERNELYKRYGGWGQIQKWMELSCPEDITKTYSTLKKYSLLREYSKKGLDVSRIIQTKSFETCTPKKLVSLVNSMFSKINTDILDNEGAVSLGNNMSERLTSYCMRPQYGVFMGYPTIDDAFLGLQTGRALFFGFLSNTGKSRMLINLVCHVAFTQKQRVLIMSNEMDEETWEKSYITTVLNNPEYWDLHGVHDFYKPEREIILGQYREDSTGEFLMRHYNRVTGEYTETEEEFVKRLSDTSEEYRNVMKVSEWLENEKNQYITFKDITDDYSESAIRFEMRKHSMLYGTKYFAVDTLKSDSSEEEDWKAFKYMATKLQEFAREVGGCLIANFQLADVAVSKDAFELSSLDIASSKGIKQVCDYMLLGKRIDRKDYYKYEYYPTSVKEDDGTNEWGEQQAKKLDKNKDYLIMKVEKNRVTGMKPYVLFEINLDLNQWIDLGICDKINYGKK